MLSDTQYTSMADAEIVRPGAPGEVENLTPEQVSLIRGRRYNRVKKSEYDGEKGTERSGDQNEPHLRTADTPAAAHGVPPATIKRDGSKTAYQSDTQNVEVASEPAAAHGVPPATIKRDPGPMPGEFPNARKKRDTPPGTDQADDLLRGRHEIGAVLGISAGTLSAMMSAGRLPFEVWHAPPAHKVYARRSDVEAAAADQSWRPRRGRGPTKPGPELIRRPDCGRYEQCLDKYARQDRLGRPGVTQAGECPGWSCDGCPRYVPAGPRDPADIKLLCVLAALIAGCDPAEILKGERWRDARRAALPSAE